MTPQLQDLLTWLMYRAKQRDVLVDGFILQVHDKKTGSAGVISATQPELDAVVGKNPKSRKRKLTEEMAERKLDAWDEHCGKVKDE